MGQTMVEKIAQVHAVERAAERSVRAGQVLWLAPRHLLTHDNSAPVLARWRALGASRIHDPRQPVIVLDHDIQNRSDENLAKYRAIEAFAREQGLEFHAAGEGIGHQIVVERLFALPGALVVAADSHANMYGAVSALGTAVTRTDAAGIWARGSFWWRVPHSVEVVLEGRLPPAATGKDVILLLCAAYAAGEVRNAAIEFTGPGVATLSMDERLTIANMTTEWGAACGWFPVDRVTLDYLDERAARWAHDERLRARIESDLLRARTDPPRPDPDALYDARIELDLGTVVPHVAGPDTVTRATPLGEIELLRIPVHKAYLVSCANSRAADLAAAAAVLDGRRVAPGVELYVAAASREVQEESERSGDWGRLLDAGARPLPPGCGPCIGLGTGLLRAGETGISATNRNFKGRMGSPEARCYLASPAIVAASAIAGIVCGPQTTAAARARTSCVRSSARPEPTAWPALRDDFPSRISGRLVLLDRDNVDTDAIYAAAHTYRDATSIERMAEVVLEHYDPTLAARLVPGDVLVAGSNFGCGSSREQAVTALAAAGVTVVLAASFAATYLRNALNHGFLALEHPRLVGWLRERYGGKPWVIPGAHVVLDFAGGEARIEDHVFPLPPPDLVAQTLVAEGGLAGWLRHRRTEGEA